MKSINRTNNEKKHNKQPLIKKVFVKKRLLIVCFAIVILSLFLEILKVNFNLELFEILNKVYTILAIPIIVMIFKECVKQDIDENQKIAKQKRTFSINPIIKSKMFVKAVGRKFLASGFINLVLVGSLMVIPAVAAAENRTTGKIIEAISNFKYSETENETTTVEESNPAEMSNEDEIFTEESFSESSTPPISNAEMFLTDPYRKFCLSESEYDKLYFLNGKSAINDYSDIDSIVEVLDQYICALQQQRKDNCFDEFAPQSLRDEVSYASQLETKMATSDDLDTIIELRLNAWNQYPKLSLAKLLAANQQRYALEYEKVDAEFYTIEYYYAQSIFWLFETLAFKDLDSYTRKMIFDCLEMRYHDIAAIAPEGSLNQRYSQALSEAFRVIKNS